MKKILITFALASSFLILIVGCGKNPINTNQVSSVNEKNKVAADLTTRSNKLNQEVASFQATIESQLPQASADTQKLWAESKQSLVEAQAIAQDKITELDHARAETWAQFQASAEGAVGDAEKLFASIQAQLRARADLNLPPS